MSVGPLQNVQLTVLIDADRGLLHKSSVVRFRLRVRPDVATHHRPSGQPSEFDELFEFPSERQPVHAAAPGHFLKSLLRVSTLAAFAAGVAVGASSGRLELTTPQLPTVAAPAPPTRVPAARSQPVPATLRTMGSTELAVVAVADAVDGTYRHPAAQ